jgi:hypothetical protein
MAKKARKELRLATHRQYGPEGKILGIQAKQR